MGLYIKKSTGHMQYIKLLIDCTDYSGTPAHLGRNSAQPDRVSAHLIQSAVQLTLAADQHT